MVLEFEKAWFRQLGEGVVLHGREEKICVLGEDRGEGC